MKTVIDDIQLIIMDGVDKKTIAPGVILHKSQKTKLNSNVESYIFRLEVQVLKIVEIQCDFTGSTNIIIKQPVTSTLKCTEIVQPFVPPTLVAHLELLPEWRLKTKFRLTFKSPSKEVQAKWIDAENKSIKSQIMNIETLFRTVQISLLPWEDILNQLQHSHLNYLDLQFPPIQISILGKQDRTLLDDTLTQWRRPNKFLVEPYSLIYKIQPNVLQSGKLGHEAFYSVLRCLSHKPALIQRLFFNSSQVNPYSIYKLRLCNNGEWQSIFIDDFIPCEPIGDPKFIRSTENELWPMLIQKAYAKTFNNYFSLRQLSIQDVFQDLTGCPTYTMPIDFSYDQLKRVEEAIQKGCIVSLYAKQQMRDFQEDDFNPIQNRAYSIMRLNEDLSQIAISTQKGQILMQLEQAKAKFKYACVCDVSSWQEIRIKGKFIKVQHSIHPDQINIMSKWYYTFELHEETLMSICLHQQDINVGQNTKHKPYLIISLVLFKRGHSSILTPIAITDFLNERSNYIDITLSVGSYILVPITQSQLEPTNGLPERQLVQDVFRKLDLLMTRELKYPEIKSLCNSVKQNIDQQKYLSWLKKYTKLKGFGLSTFKRLWHDYRVLWIPQIQQLSLQRLFVLSLHSKNQISVLVKDSKGTDLDNRAHIAMIKKHGYEIKTKYKQIRLYILKLHSHSTISYFVENISTDPIQIELDCTKSNGYNFMPITGKARRKLQVSQSEYIMQLIPRLTGALNTISHQEEITVNTLF